MIASALWFSAAALATFSAGGVVQLLTIALIVAAAYPVLRSKTKDATISEQAASITAKTERIIDLEADLRGCKQRADAEHAQHLESERRVAKLEGQLEEQSKYTAKEAFETITGQLGKIEALLSAWITKDAMRGTDTST